MDDVADADGLVELLGPRLLEQGHGDEAITLQRDLEHALVARLEDVEREHRAGEEHDLGQREDRNRFRESLENGVEIGVQRSA